NFACDVEREDVLEALANEVRHALTIVTDLKATHFNIFQQKIVGFQRWDTTCRKTDHDKATAPRERTQGCIEHVVAQRVDDAVYALAATDGVDLLAQIVAKVVCGQIDNVTCANFKRLVAARKTGDAGDYRCTL